MRNENAGAGDTVASGQDAGAADTVASGQDAGPADTVASGQDAGAADTVASGETLPPDGLPAATGQVARSRRFGKLEVLEQLGVGGMGEVVAAWDPDLNRKVAVKVLHGLPGTGQVQDRLLREAQAMARLSHPNVITVHQVGTRGGQVYMVMEHVDGGTLRDWAARKPRHWQEVVAIYLAAGEGLAAAHAAGLVHRDFKPDNVLVRSDGRALVTDFGLVASVVDGALGAEQGAEDTAPPTPSSNKLELRLTRTGEVMGTPYYMAPEQHAGERSDARADQFAFCVALFEALYGQRPFSGESYRELFAAVTRGKPRPAPAAARVPARLYRALVRGLAVDPDDRYPDMVSLLAELRARDLSKSRRRWLIGGGLGAAAAAVALIAVTLRSAPGARCAATGDAVARAWGAHRRNALVAHLEGRPADARRLVGLVDRYAERWRRERVAACEATHVTGEQSPALLDRRMLCLDRRLGKLSKVIARVERPEGVALVRTAVEAVELLPGFAECRDKDLMLARALPHPSLRAKVDRIEEDLDEAFAARVYGEYHGALSTAERALSRAKRAGYAPVMARAHYLVGLAAYDLARHSAAEEHFRQAVRLAVRAKAYRIEAEVWPSLIYLVGHSRGRPEPALAMAAAAEAAVVRAGDEPVLRGRLQGNLGLVRLSGGDYAAARAKLEASLATFRRAYGDDHLDTATARNNVALLLEKLGHHRQAKDRLLEALAVREKRLGRDHPAVATTLNDLGNTADSMGRHQEAKRYLERALAIRSAALGEDHPRTAETLNNLAVVLDSLGQTTRALAMARRAVSVSERAFGKSHPELAGPLNTLGNLLRDQGERRLAWEAFARGLAIVEHARGKQHATVAPMVENLARLLSEMGLHDRALAFVDRAIAVRQKATGKDHPLTINAVALRGSFNLAAGKPADAVRDFERQRSLCIGRYGEGHSEVGLAEHNRAVALEAAGKLVAADEAYRTAAANLERTAPRHQALVNATRGQGDVSLARGRRKEAAAHYERALAKAKAAGLETAELVRLLNKARGRR